MCIKDVSAIQVRNQIKLCIKQWSCSVLGVVLDPLRFLHAGPQELVERNSSAQCQELCLLLTWMC